MDQAQVASLDELLAAVARGDRRAFARLYDHAAPKLFTLALRLMRNRAAAEEILQEAFVRVWARAGDFDPDKGAALGWMVTILRNAALDRLRHERPAMALDEAPDIEAVPDPGADPLSATMSNAEARALRHCLDQLEPAPRRAILLAYWHGLSHEELAGRLDAPLGTVKSWIRRGMVRLKGCLGP